MKSHALLFVGLSLFALAACDRRDGDDASPDTSAAATDAAATSAAGTQTAADATTDPAAAAPIPDASGQTSDMAAPTADDSLALGLLGAVNDHEIAAAKQAKDKKVSAPVRDYADLMEKEHSENQTKTKSLGTLASTPEVQAMVDKSKAKRDELAAKSGKEYETAYIDAMVNDHTEALSLIDTRLIALASSDAVKKHMTQTREHVAMHLERAKKLQEGENK